MTRPAPVIRPEIRGCTRVHDRAYLLRLRRS
ncbi:hypothetical protein HNR23_004754 [Nocardiopsis mwathae]|uniref:Uncharacterized protein n=1 Tax=Nocardiopsis mwathae TaxID=1472723 RepID=A0A7X0D951_9ACTN|nr:hypothetical protein [Nocardiopsis mwathae]